MVLNATLDFLADGEKKHTSWGMGATAMKVRSRENSQILVIDAGGTNIKLLATGQKEPRKNSLRSAMTAGKMVAK